MLKKTFIAAAAASALLLAGCASSPSPSGSNAQTYTWTARLATLKANLEAATKGTGVIVEQTANNQLRVVMPNDRSFDVGRATIKRELADVLDKIAEGMRGATRASTLVVGHTDNVGGESANEKLSLARADNARSHLVAHGLAGEAVKIDGRGEREPLADNNTVAGRAQNRRVEIFITDRG